KKRVTAKTPMSVSQRRSSTSSKVRSNGPPLRRQPKGPYQRGYPAVDGRAGSVTGGRAVQPGSVGAAVESGQPSIRAGRQQAHMRDLREMLRDRPEVVLRGHPPEAVEPGQRQRTRVAAQGPLSIPVVVVVEVRHDQLAKRAIDRRAETEASELRESDRAPKPAIPMDR